MQEAKIDDLSLKRATVENTAVITLGNYHPNIATLQLAPLLNSAKKHGINVQIVGIGEPYQSFQSKIVSLKKFIDGLPASKQFVLYIDGRDVIVLHPLATICNKFNDLGYEIVISAEHQCYPVKDQDWVDLFPCWGCGRDFPNAGIWMGERNALSRAFDILLKMKEKLKATTSPPEFKNIWEYRVFARDDQFLWQLAFITNAFNVRLDWRGELSVNVNGTDRKLEDNNDFDFKECEVRVKATNAFPSLIHFSGKARDRHLEKWARFLNVH